jgi:hypothetical protein
MDSDRCDNAAHTCTVLHTPAVLHIPAQSCTQAAKTYKSLRSSPQHSALGDTIIQTRCFSYYEPPGSNPKWDTSDTLQTFMYSPLVAVAYFIPCVCVCVCVCEREGVKHCWVKELSMNTKITLSE